MEHLKRIIPSISIGGLPGWLSPEFVPRQYVEFLSQGNWRLSEKYMKNAQYPIYKHKPRKKKIYTVLIERPLLPQFIRDKFPISFNADLQFKYNVLKATHYGAVEFKQKSVDNTVQYAIKVRNSRMIMDIYNHIKIPTSFSTLARIIATRQYKILKLLCPKLYKRIYSIPHPCITAQLVDEFIKISKGCKTFPRTRDPATAVLQMVQNLDVIEKLIEVGWAKQKGDRLQDAEKWYSYQIPPDIKCRQFKFDGSHRFTQGEPSYSNFWGVTSYKGACHDHGKIKIESCPYPNIQHPNTLIYNLQNGNVSPFTVHVLSVIKDWT